MRLSRRSLLATTAGSLPFVLSRRTPAVSQVAPIMEDLDRIASALLLQLILIKDTSFTGCICSRSNEKKLGIEKSQGVSICMLAPGSSGAEKAIARAWCATVRSCCCVSLSGFFSPGGR
jgi:hypothetical protein